MLGRICGKGVLSLKWKRVGVMMNDGTADEWNEKSMKESD